MVESPVVESPVVGSQVVGSPVVGSPKVGSQVVGSPVVGSPVVGNHRLLLGNPQSGFKMDSGRIQSDGEDTDNETMDCRIAGNVITKVESTVVGSPVVGNHRLLLENPQSGLVTVKNYEKK